jgi:hypothetical protein
MQWLQTADDLEHAVDELLTFVVRELAEDDTPPKMFVTVRVTPRAPKGTLARNFD